MREELSHESEVRDELQLTQSADEIGTVKLNLTLLPGSEPPPQGMMVGESFAFALPPLQSMIIGKAQGVEFRILSPSVGMRVVRLTFRTEGIWVEDLGSGGGSAVVINGVTISRPVCYLAEGAILQIGAVPFRVATTHNPGR